MNETPRGYTLKELAEAEARAGVSSQPAFSPMSVQYRGIKVPDPIYENARILRQRALQVGFDRIPKEITTLAECPLCKGPLEGFQVAYQYVQCPNCGYRHQQLAAGGSGALGLGVIIGLGLAALASLISESESSKSSRRTLRRSR